MGAAFREGDRVQTCEWDADDQAYTYGPPGTVLRVYEQNTRMRSMLADPAYDVRNESNGRICYRFEWELVRVPFDGPMPSKSA